MRAQPFHGFNDVPGGEAGFIRGAAGNHGNHRGIAKALGNGGPHIRLAFILLLLEDLVLGRGEIAGVGIERFQQPMQRAVGDHAHIGLFHVFRAHPVKHLTVNANVLERDITAAAAGGVYAHGANQHKSDDQHGAGEEENLDLF